MEGIPGWVGLASPIGATLAVFWLVLTGKLIPRSSYDAFVQVMTDSLTRAESDRDGWKASSERKGETIQVLTNTNAELIETARTTRHVMSSLQEAGGPH
jgi:hypothetical protein